MGASWLCLIMATAPAGPLTQKASPVSSSDHGPLKGQKSAAQIFVRPNVLFSWRQRIAQAPMSGTFRETLHGAVPMGASWLCLIMATAPAGPLTQKASPVSSSDHGP